MSDKNRIPEEDLMALVRDAYGAPDADAEFPLEVEARVDEYVRRLLAPPARMGWKGVAAVSVAVTLVLLLWGSSPRGWYYFPAILLFSGVYGLFVRWLSKGAV